ncbi:hypothetical protein P692DRAFT_2065789 [Suillus brevipes Sb2]|nr:hypothetical protein P692DRAFT_2065789 [Suillus brevipes Sb2]
MRPRQLDFLRARRRLSFRSSGLHNHWRLFLRCPWNLDAESRMTDGDLFQSISASPDPLLRMTLFFLEPTSNLLLWQYLQVSIILHFLKHRVGYFLCQPNR